MKHKLGKKIIISLAFGALVWIGFSIWADLGSLLQAFRDVNPFYIIVVLFLVLANYFIRFIKWDYYLKILNIHISKRDSLYIFFSGLSMSITPGKMGELLKCYLLKKINKTSMSYSSPIIIAERITDFISLIVIAMIGVYVVGYGKNIVISFGILFILLVAVISSKPISLKLIGYLENIKFLEKYVKKIHIAYESIYNLVKIKPLLFAFFISLVGWFCECMGLYVVYSSFNLRLELSITVVSFIYSFSTLVGAISFIPGGLAVTDVSLSGLFVLFGKLPKNYAVAITFIIRAVTLWFAVLIGSIVLLIYQKKIHVPMEEIENIEIEAVEK